jgi:hypothetical protein
MAARRIPSNIPTPQKETQMPDVSRRQFLRRASYGAAATGVLAAGGATLFEAVGSAGASSLAADASPATPALAGSDIFAHVVDARSGEITIFVGTKSVSYKNQALAQQLLRAAQ